MLHELQRLCSGICVVGSALRLLCPAIPNKRHNKVYGTCTRQGEDVHNMLYVDTQRQGSVDEDCGEKKWGGLNLRNTSRGEKDLHY